MIRPYSLRGLIPVIRTRHREMIEPSLARLRLSTGKNSESCESAEICVFHIHYVVLTAAPAAW